MHTKKGIELVEGDEIISEGTFPITLYAGQVEAVIVVDSGVQIQLAGGGSYIRPEDHVFHVSDTQSLLGGQTKNFGPNDA